MNKELATSIGSAARAARKALGLTQEDTAERIQVSVEFYARIERGTSLPSILTFARIVSVLGVSADALLGQAVYRQQASWVPPTPNDRPEIRRLVRRLRKARSSTVRFVNLLLKEVEERTHSEQKHSTSSSSDGRAEDDSVSRSDGDSEADRAGDSPAQTLLPASKTLGPMPAMVKMPGLPEERPIASNVSIFAGAAE